MFVSVDDLRLYDLCESILDSKQLDPNLSNDLRHALTRSYLKDKYFINKSYKKIYKNLNRKLDH